jgi:adenosylcobinamide-phosphate synthase
LIEQARALAADNALHASFGRYASALERRLDTGQFQHGVLAWLVAVMPFVLVAAVLSANLHGMAPVAALAFDIAVLYFTMGFRQFSHRYGEVLDALRAGNLQRAADSVRAWAALPDGELGKNDVARLAMERGLFSAHRHVFGVIAWFAVFGAAGAVLYRLAAMLHDRWGRRSPGADEGFGAFSRSAFQWIDWVPVRLTAISFAVVGDFEDALYCWRTQAAMWGDRSEGVVLASGAGALGVRLGATLGTVEPLEVRSEIGTGEEADAELMTSAVGLIWRALVLWLFVILLVTVASWLG